MINTLHSPLISVIIPAHNSEKTIRQTIHSVLSQTFSNFELIVINDGSTDSTLEIITDIHDKRVKFFLCNNGNAGASRNLGIHHASGKFIAFLDADDIWAPDKLEKQLHALHANPQAAVAYTWVDCIDEHGNFLHNGSHYSGSGDVFKKLLLTNFLDNGSNPLIRTQALKEVGLFDELLTNSEDRDMYLRLAYCYHFVAVPSPLTFYRISTKTKSYSNLFNSEKSFLILIEKAYSQAPGSLQSLKKQSYSNHYNYLIKKALNGYLGWHRSLVAIRLALNYIIKAPYPFGMPLLSKSLLFEIVTSTPIYSYLRKSHFYRYIKKAKLGLSLNEVF